MIKQMKINSELELNIVTNILRQRGFTLYVDHHDYGKPCWVIIYGNNKTFSVFYNTANYPDVTLLELLTEQRRIVTKEYTYKVYDFSKYRFAQNGEFNLAKPFKVNGLKCQFIQAAPQIFMLVCMESVSLPPNRYTENLIKLTSTRLPYVNASDLVNLIYPEGTSSTVRLEQS